MGTSRKHVLIVDDDQDLRDIIGEVLRDSGIRYAAAADGGIALDMLRSNEHPGVILLDMMMPHVDGWKFRAEQIADPNLKDIPVIVMSASAKAVRTHPRMNAAGYISKPFELNKLIEEVSKYVF